MAQAECTQVTITLTLQEARVLRKVCARIGGDPKTTYRGQMNSIADALDSVGVTAIDAEFVVHQDALTFKD